MSRQARIWLNIGAGAAILTAALLVVAIQVVQTEWFRNYVRNKIVSATEDGTGGRVEIGSYSFDWHHLRSTITDFVIHGDEPAGSAPYLRARRVQLDLSLFTSIHHWLDVTYLAIERPEANIIVFPDGHTNVPAPKTKSQSAKTPLETVADLAVGRFELTDGLIVFASQRQPLEMSGRNLRAQLFYNPLNQGYQGQLSFQPSYRAAGRRPVDLTVTLPVGLERDRITLRNATIATASSSLAIDGTIENLRDPRFSAHVRARVAPADLREAMNLPAAPAGRGAPAALEVDANATVAANSIQVTGARLSWGRSNFEASGTLRDPQGRGALQFKSRLDLTDLGRLGVSPARLAETVSLSGTARLDSRKLELRDVRLSGFGGQLTADASLEDFARFQARGNLGNFNLAALTRALGLSQFPYSGTFTGSLEASGDLRARDTVTASARLAITPGRNGVPVSGRIRASYSQGASDVVIDNSFVALPHSRIAVNGSLKKQLQFAVSSTDLHDLAQVDTQTVILNGGQLSIQGVVTGSLAAPQITAHVAGTKFAVAGRRFDEFQVDAAVSGSGATLRNGSLRRGAMQADFAGSVGLRNWKALPGAPLSADASIRNGDLADVLALAGQPAVDYSGMLGANLHLAGTVGNPQGTAQIEAANGTLHGETYDRIQMQVNLVDQLIAIPAASVEAGQARITLSAEYRHPRDSFLTGQLHGRLQSTPIDLAKLQGLQKQRPNTTGIAQVSAEASARLSHPARGGEAQTAFQLTQVVAAASARGIRSEGQNYGDATLNARTDGQTVSYSLNSNFAGSNIRIDGSTQLADGYPTTADVNLSNLPVEQVLAAAHRTDIPAKGTVSGAAHLTGTVARPQGNLDLNLANGVLYGEPLDRVHARVAYVAESLDVQQFEVAAGPSRIELTAHYQHAQGNLQPGDLQFRLGSSRVDLAKIRNLQARRPGIGGVLELAASGAARVSASEPRIAVQNLNASLRGDNLSSDGKKVGDIKLTASTAGARLNCTLDSTVAMATIHGQGAVDLRADYPLEGRLTFANVSWARIQDLLGPQHAAANTFEVALDGEITGRGPMMKADQLTAALQITRVQASMAPAARPAANTLLLQNQGPIVVALNRNAVQIQSAHLSGPQSDFQATGTVPLNGRPMDVNLKGDVNLALLKAFNREVDSSGAIALAVTVRGAIERPLINGQAELRSGMLSYAGVSNGIANLNGVIQFSGDAAQFRNITAESGGGRVTLNGFLALRSGIRFGLRANGSNVRVGMQGVSVVTDSNLNLTGTPENSMISGTVAIQRVTYAPTADLGSVLTAAEPPVQSSAPSPLLDNMKLDLRIQTSSGTIVQSSLAQNLRADADLRIRGTVNNPGMLGRVTLNEGQLVFFGSTYAVDSGTIGFFNPIRIEPVLDMNLETKAKGVTVSLRVNGPIDNLKLSYTSDPPLQFQEIISLLAAGTTPTSDPTLLANQPSQAPHSFQQMGESALLSKAIADPLANRLQRVFGVSQFKIDPTFTSGSELPQAQLTMQQRVATNIMFTYVTALNNANAQTIRVEMTLNPQWSAMATRDQNGIFSINLLYKRQIR